jgi:AraC-like DNA-binding protein
LGQPPFMYREVVDESSKAKATEKYARSSLREDSARYYLDKLETSLREHKAYLESDLTLRTLASMIKLSPHHLSQILNEQLGKSFYDYINEHRIAHAMTLLADKSNAAMSVLNIAFASGYNNKVSFYTAFKKTVGMTPTRYREAAGAAQPIDTAGSTRLNQ